MPHVQRIADGIQRLAMVQAVGIAARDIGRFVVLEPQQGQVVAFTDHDALGLQLGLVREHDGVAAVRQIVDQTLLVRIVGRVELTPLFLELIAPLAQDFLAAVQPILPMAVFLR